MHYSYFQATWRLGMIKVNSTYIYNNISFLKSCSEGRWISVHVRKDHIHVIVNATGKSKNERSCYKVWENERPAWINGSVHLPKLSLWSGINMISLIRQICSLKASNEEELRIWILNFWGKPLPYTMPVPTFFHSWNLILQEATSLGTNITLVLNCTINVLVHYNTPYIWVA